MLHEGRARELARIRAIVMLACPNSGSEYLLSLRKALRYGRHPQAANLTVLNQQVADTQRTVLQRIVNATGLDDLQCPIPFHVYAGNSDRVVTATSAKGAFPGASTLAGNHFSILDPSAPGNRSAETVKHHLLTDLASSGPYEARQTLSVFTGSRDLSEAISASVETRGTVGLRDLVEHSSNDEFPAASSLDPYLLGATISPFGDSGTYGARDPYLPRNHNNVDAQLDFILRERKLVLIVGPSKAGKTRTAYEAVRRNFPDALLVSPYPGTIDRLLEHESIRSTDDTIVVWLDDLDRYLVHANPLTPALLNKIFNRPAHTAVIGTLRSERRAALVGDDDELERDNRQLLEQARSIDLAATSKSTIETAAAGLLYPGQELQHRLAAHLAGASNLLVWYDAVSEVAPAARYVLEVAIDWARIGRPDPIPQPLLSELARARLMETRPELATGQEIIDEAIERTRLPLPGAVGCSAPYLLDARGIRGYRAFDYLVAADDGQSHDVRAIPENFWDAGLTKATPDAAYAVGVVAIQRRNVPIALKANAIAADAGNTDAATNLGFINAVLLNPPDLGKAITYYETAAAKGSVQANNDLGTIYSDLLPQKNPTKARGYYEAAAKSGHVVAMHNFAKFLSDLDPPDLDDSIYWYEKAAKLGYVQAMVNLANLLEYQLDAPDQEKAKYWLEIATTLGDTRAAINLAGLLMDTEPPELERARQLLEAPVESGDDHAMYTLGVLNISKKDPPDVEAGKHWLRRAATAGNLHAMYLLGDVLRLREPVDLADARRWLTKAAQAGDIDAMAGLGQLFIVQQRPANPDEAIPWLTKAAKAEHAGAMRDLGYALAFLADPPDIDTARVWLEKAAEQGDVAAMLTLAQLLAKKAKPADESGALRWLTKAAERGEIEAMASLGWMLADQTEPDIEGARHWLERAAEAEHTTAMGNLGRLLTTLIVPPEFDQGMQWLEKAAEKGWTNSMNLIGYLSMHRDPPDDDKARYWLELASEMGDPEAMVNYAALLLTESIENFDVAVELYEKAIGKGNSSAYLGYATAVVFAEPPDLAKAETLLQQAAAAGDPMVDKVRLQLGL